MSPAFWIKRFLTVAFFAFAVLTIVELLKGHELVEGILFAAGWGVLAAAVFTGTRIYRSRKGEHCPICNDTPDAK